jgi:DNA repair exonuclease SbcCD ATPase subunit
VSHEHCDCVEALEDYIANELPREKEHHELHHAEIERLRAAAEQSVAGGLVAYVHRLRENHAATVTPEGRLGVCRCGESGCAKALLLLHIDDLLAAYQLKVDDFARETAEVERLRAENTDLATLTHWRKRAEKAEDEVERLRAEVKMQEGYHAEVERLRAEADRMERLANERWTEVERLRGKLAERGNTIREQRAEIESLRAEVAEVKRLTDLLRVQEREVERLTEEKRHARIDAENAQAEVERLQGLLLRQTQLNEEAFKEVERQTERADHWQHQFHVMGETANKAEREVERLRDERGDSLSRWNQIAESEAEVERLQGELETNRRECESSHVDEQVHDEEVERLRSQYEAMKSLADVRGAEIEKWKGRYVFARSEFDRLVLERRVESGTA